MVYQVPASKASLAQNKFKFKIPGESKTYSVPLLKFLRPAFVRRLETMTEQQVVFALLDEFHPDALEKLDDLDQVVALYTAWAEASGIDVGELSGSDDSSKDIAEPSTETSSSQDETSTTSAA